MMLTIIWMIFVAYTIKKLSSKDITYDIGHFIYEAAVKVNYRYGSLYPNSTKFPIQKFADKGILFVCFRNDEPVGFLGATLNHSFFDPEVKILFQQLLYSSPGTRASYYLLKEFIDFGRTHANHVVTMIGTETNIKSRSLERFGFRKIEEFYRMEF